MELDGAGNPVREYAYYPGIDQPNAMRRVSDGAVFRYTQEQPGHVSGLVGAGNVVVNTYAYTPWGEPIATQEQVEQPLRYAAREYDKETGLYFVRARYFDPRQGRFVSEDPIGLEGGINPYAYAANDPGNLVDPSGLRPGCERGQVEVEVRYDTDGDGRTTLLELSAEKQAGEDACMRGFPAFATCRAAKPATTGDRCWASYRRAVEVEVGSLARSGNARATRSKGVFV